MDLVMMMFNCQQSLCWEAGGTVIAAIALVEKLGGVVVESAFIVDLPDIGGSKKLQDNGYKMFSLTEFEGH